MTHRDLFGIDRPTVAEHSRCIKEQLLASLPDEARKTAAASFGEPRSAGTIARAKRTGNRAPDFSLPSARSGQIRLSEALHAGPVVLSFHRGGWCPFCQLEFEALQDYLPQIKALGATLIGISPETRDNSARTVERFQLRFEVLSDQGNRVARQYGLVMTVDEALRPLYVHWGFDLPRANGDDSYQLPLPATYVIDTDGVIQAAHVDGDCSVRMEPEEVVRILRCLKSP